MTWMPPDPPQGGLRAYDLEAPPTKTLAAAMMEPRPCRICGRERPGLMPLIAREDGPHASCQRQYHRWLAQSQALRHGPEMDVTWAAIEAAEAERDRVYAEQLTAAGIPDWFVKEQVEDLYD